MAKEQGKQGDADLLEKAYGGHVNTLDDAHNQIAEEPWFHWNGRAVTGDNPLHRSESQEPSKMPDWSTFSDGSKPETNQTITTTPDNHYQDKYQSHNIERKKCQFHS